jgi:hypothetical protein
MARYFLHLKDSIDQVLDPDGLEMPPEAVPGVALVQARDCIAGDVKAGRLDLHYRIEVFSEDSQLVHTLHFKDALEVAPPR